MTDNNENGSIYEHTIYLSINNCLQPMGSNIAQFKFPLPNTLNLTSNIADYFASLSYFEFTDSYVYLPFNFVAQFGDIVDDVVVWSNDVVDLTVYCNSIESLATKLAPLLDQYSCRVSTRKKKGICQKI